MTRKRNTHQDVDEQDKDDQQQSDETKQKESKAKNGQLFPKANSVVIGITVITLSLGLTFLTSILYSIFVSSNSWTKTDSSLDKNDVLTWRPARENIVRKYGSSICTIDRKNVKDITKEKFEKEYRYIKPLIVTFPNGAKDWTIPDKWTVTSLNREYGDWVVSSGNSMEIVRRGGNGDIHTSFSEFVGNIIRETDSTGEPFYIFDRKFYNESSLPQTLKPPSIFKIVDGIDDSIFFLGASSSGVTFHKHADSWNGVIFGQKRWFLYPIKKTPPGGVPAGFTTLDWFEMIYPKLNDTDKPLECIQQPGEILYLPESFYHGTINLGDTVAVGIQKKQASTEAEKLFYEDTRIVGSMREKISTEERKKLMNRRIELYKKLHEMLPSSAEICERLSNAYIDNEDVDNGLIYIQKAVENDPYFVNAFLEKGKMLTMKKKYEESEESFKRALELNPRLWDVYAGYGDLLLEINKLPEAIDIYRQGFDLRPDMIPFLLHIMEAQKRMGDEEGVRQTEFEIERRSRRVRH